MPQETKTYLKLHSNIKVANNGDQMWLMRSRLYQSIWEKKYQWEQGQGVEKSSGKPPWEKGGFEVGVEE